ncbi:MAG: hypothetical protein RIQ51_1124 [Bacteroidota bacterium]|jgi:hypothetical protein
MKLDYLEKLADAHESQFDDYEDLHEQVCDAILNNTKLSYGALNNYHTSPFDSNDLGDKVYEKSGLLLRSYIKGDDEEMLAIMKHLCKQEIDSIIDLIGD